MSPLARSVARKRIAGAELRRELEVRGIVVRCASKRSRGVVKG